MEKENKYMASLSISVDSDLSNQVVDALFRSGPAYGPWWPVFGGVTKPAPQLTLRHPRCKTRTQLHTNQHFNMASSKYNH